MAGIVHVPWYATGLRGDALEQALEEISRLSLRYGATSYHVYRYRDDRYRFLQVIAWNDKLDWERFWEGQDFIDFRVINSGYYQVPVVYQWADQVAHGEVAPEPVTPGADFKPEEGTYSDTL
jgi:hypothetical protein